MRGRGRKHLRGEKICPSERHCTPQAGRTPLHKAAKRGRAAVVEQLLAAGAGTEANVEAVRGGGGYAGCGWYLVGAQGREVIFLGLLRQVGEIDSSSCFCSFRYTSSGGMDLAPVPDDSRSPDSETIFFDIGFGWKTM